MDECVGLRSAFLPASVGAGTQNKVNTTIRRNDAVMLDDVFRRAPDKSRILSIVGKRIAEKECRDLWHDGYTLFDTINYATWKESVLSRYGQCEFYGKHQDTMRNPDVPGEITRRLVTLVAYWNEEPEQFTGGEITFYHNDASISVTPKHNRVVVFPSFMLHEVNRVQLPDNAPHSAGRFSLNMWLGFK